MTNQTQLSTFNFEQNSIRTLVINKEPWFVAKDICDAIGIDNNRKALLALDEDEKGVTLSNTLGGQQEMNIVSESGMYTLILRCRDAVKKGSVPHRFRKWVTAEVLPTIRKTGSYNATQKQLALPEPELTFKYEFKENELQAVAWGWFALSQCIETLGIVAEPLQMLNSRFDSTAYSQAIEYMGTLR